jgi:hypothetical protein
MENAVLIDGVFSVPDALELLNAMYMQKIRFHESKIHHSDSEEDIKFREEKIKHMQAQLHHLRTHLKDSSMVQLHAEIAVSPL